jgi:hypothetical protein
MDDALGRRGPGSCCTEGLAGLVVVGPGPSGPRMPDPIVVVGRQHQAGVHIALHCSCIAECKEAAAEEESLPMMSWLRKRKGTVPAWSVDLVEWARCSSSRLDSRPDSGRRSSWT